MSGISAEVNDPAVVSICALLLYLCSRLIIVTCAVGRGITIPCRCRGALRFYRHCVEAAVPPGKFRQSALEYNKSTMHRMAWEKCARAQQLARRPLLNTILCHLCA